MMGEEDDSHTIGGSEEGKLAVFVVGCIRERAANSSLGTHPHAEQIAARALLIAGMELMAAQLGSAATRQFIFELLEQGLPAPAGDNEFVRH